MDTKPTEPTKRKAGDRDGKVLGRSALSGRNVMKPAVKGGTVSIERVRAAVKSASKEKR